MTGTPPVATTQREICTQAPVGRPRRAVDGWCPTGTRRWKLRQRDQRSSQGLDRL